MRIVASLLLVALIAACSDAALPPGVLDAATAGDVGAPSVDAATDAGLSLYDDYQSTSPHYSHVSPMYTDFFYGWTPADRDWAAAHFDMVMSGTMSEWKSRNTTIKHIPYRLHWSIFQPDQSNTDFAALSTWYGDPKLNAHGYALETALLHYAAGAQFRDFANATTAERAAYKAAANDVTKLPLVTAKGDGSSAERLQTHIWDSWRYIYNPADAGASAYLQYVLAGIVGQGHDGVFYDEYGSGGMSAAHTSLELTTTTYDAASVAQMAAERAAFPGKVIMPNTAEYLAPYDIALMTAAGYAHMEKMNNPLVSALPSRWSSVSAAMAAGVVVELVAAYTWSDTLPSSYVAGNYASPILRLKMAELASYYMIRPVDASKMLLDQDNFWTVAPGHSWLVAEEADIGAPTAARSLIAKGTDGVGQTYQVYARDYDRALVLMRPIISSAPSDYTDASKVTVALPDGHTWYFLDADGTTRGPVSSVDLRVAEAVIVTKNLQH